MNVLILVLNEVEYMNDILDKFVEVGVTGATIIDSQGMGSAITNSGRGTEPFFGAIRQYLDNARPYNKTIFTVIKDEEVLNAACQSVKEILGNMSRPGVGMMFTLPVGETFGLDS